MMSRRSDRMTPLPRSFLARPAEVVAPALLGHVLVRTLGDGRRLAGRIVEAEAYLGPQDRASHAFNGRRTARNESMYARPGTCYVYLTYGMHWMCNVACLREGHPAAVLIRALAPVEGIELMRVHRPAGRDRDLCSGPAKLCQALAISGDLDGLDLLTDPRLRLIQSPAEGLTDLGEVTTSSRVGVDACGAWAEAPLRWYFRGCPHVSRGRPSRDRRGAADHPAAGRASRRRPRVGEAPPNRVGPASEGTQ